MSSIVLYMSSDADCLSRVPQNVNSEIIRPQLQVYPEIDHQQLYLTHSSLSPSPARTWHL